MKIKILSLLVSIVLITSCNLEKNHSPVPPIVFETNPITEAPTEANKLLGEYMTTNLQHVEKMFIDDINNDGKLEIVCAYVRETALIYEHKGLIKEVNSNQFWGEGCDGGSGMTFYHNEQTQQTLTMTYRSGHLQYDLYDFVDNDYVLSSVFVNQRHRIPWSIERLAELTNYPPEGMSFEEFVEQSYGMGFYDSVYKYTVNEDEIDEEEWKLIIRNFKNDPNCILLCPCNEDLPYVTLEDVNGDFTGYIEEKLGL